jgi:hypothetical protein
MENFNPDAVQVAVYGGATMGALTAVVLIVNSLKKLFVLSGQDAVRLTFGVSFFVALAVVCAVYFPQVNVAMGIVILTALLAAGADAIVSQGKTANSNGIAALREEATQKTDEHPSVDVYDDAYATKQPSDVSRSKMARDLAERHI